MALEPGRHKNGSQRAGLILAVSAARARSALPVRAVLKELGLSHASYYRYLKTPEPAKRKPRAKSPPLTPAERLAVKDIALAHPATGYKSLTWSLQNEAIVGVRPHQVLALLREEELIVRREAAAPCQNKRPAAPSFPNQVWHIDLMYLWLRTRWWYLVDILDGYSRFLVHWTLNDSLAAETVSLTVLEALEMWGPELKPGIIHDRGSQFVSKDWRLFVAHHGLPSIRIRLRHPQSNGRIERLHRTHREEGLVGSDGWTLSQAKTQLSRWADQYNNLRPHSALNGLPPVVYYLGEPDAALAQREHFVQAAAQARANYWRLQNNTGCPLFEDPDCLTSA
jgi:putative transposase